MTWIWMQLPSPVWIRTIFITYVAQGSSSNVQLTVWQDGTSNFYVNMVDKLTNGLYYTGRAFQAERLWLTNTKTDFMSGGSTRLCSPEILAIEDHPLWQVAGSRTQTFVKKLYDNNNPTSETIYSDIYEVGSGNWRADWCFNYTPTQNWWYLLILDLGGYQTGSTTNLKLNELVLLTGAYLVLGPNNVNTVVRFQAQGVTIDFANKQATDGTTNEVDFWFSQSSIYSLPAPISSTGLITRRVKIFSKGQNYTEICRVVPLGYPCCFVQNIVDETSTINTYFIHPSAPKPAISKIFKLSFIIDGAKTIVNDLFCLLGLTTTVVCKTCSTTGSPPQATIVITQDGRVTVSISSTNFNHIGQQTFEINAIDSRNIEQTLGMKVSFQVTFTTCSLSINTPANKVYYLTNPTESQQITTVESDSCNWSATCSLNTSKPSWVYNNGCNIQWITSDPTALSQTPYTIPVNVIYSSLPNTQTLQTSFTITLNCNLANTFVLSAPSVTYMNRQSAGSQILSATSPCGYPITYQFQAPTLNWVQITQSTTQLSWFNDNNNLAPAVYTSLLAATFASTPPTTLTATLTITVQACTETRTFTSTPVTYRIGDSAASQVLQLTNTCQYSTTYAQITNPLISWVTNSGSAVTWSTTDVSLAIQAYTANFQVTIGTNPPTQMTVPVVITLQECIISTSSFSTTPISYKIKNTAATQTLVATNSCGYPVSYRLLNNTLDAISLVGSVVSISSQDLTLAPQVYYVDIEATFSSIPTPQAQSTVLKVTFESCTNLETQLSFSTTPVTYTIKDAPVYRTLTATDYCGYQFIFTKVSTNFPWVEIFVDDLGPQVAISSDDLTLAPTTYSITLQATFQSSPVTFIQTNLNIQILACQTTTSFSILFPVQYTINAPTQEFDLSAANSCGYPVTYSYGELTLPWVLLNTNSVSIRTTDIGIQAQDYTVSFQATFLSVPQSTLTQNLVISLAACQENLVLINPVNVTYSIKSAAENQTIKASDVSGCGYQPACTLAITAPAWVKLTNCVVSWATADQSLLLSSRQNLVVIDVSLGYNTVQQTSFYIQLESCNLATIQYTPIDDIQLFYNQKITVELKPSDSVSELLGQQNSCGQLLGSLETSQDQWLKSSLDGLELQLQQILNTASSTVITVQFTLASNPQIKATQTITVIAQNCTIESFAPATDSMNIDYSINSGTFDLMLPEFNLESDCQLPTSFVFTVRQISGLECDVNSFSVTQTEFKLTLSDESYIGEELEFEIIAQLNDGVFTQSSGLIITVKIAAESEHDQNSDKLESNESDDSNEKDEQNMNSKSDLTPIFISSLHDADMIPCLKSGQAAQWIFETPKVLATDQSAVDYEFSCPEIEDMFEADFNDGVITLLLDTQGKVQPYPGYYPASFTLFYKNQKQQAKYHTSFEIDCDAKFATVPQPIRPQPKFAQITNTGRVIITWNTNVNIRNFTANDSKVQLEDGKRRLAAIESTKEFQVKNCSIPGLDVAVRPLGEEQRSQQLRFNCTVTSYSARQLNIKLQFGEPDIISTSSYALHELVVTFNDPSYFLSEQKQMSVQKGLRMVTLLPRQVLSEAIQFKQLTTVAGASKGAMLASLGMPYILSTVLSQLLSVIRSFTIIVHMQAISLMFPANIVAFYSVLSPLVMFDLLPAQNIANKIFKFQDLSEDDPLTMQFGQLGYGSLLTVENLGSLFFLAAAYPIFILMLICIRRILPRKISNHKLGRRFTNLLDSFIKSAFWNFPINFMFESYFILCIVSFIGLKALNFKNFEVWSQLFCSIIALLGTISVLVFPILIFIVYRRMIRSNEVMPDPTKMTPSQRQAIFWIDDIESILEHCFTMKQMTEFTSKYGCLIEQVDLQRVGVTVTILFSLSDMIRKLVAAAALVFFTDKPYVVLFTFNFSCLFYTMFQLYYAPLTDHIEHIRMIVNEITVLVVVYHQFCFTDFISDYHTQNSIGTSLIFFVILNGCLNVILSLINPVSRGILWLKRFKVRLQRRKQAADNPKFKTQDPQIKVIADKAPEMSEEQKYQTNSALSRRPIGDSGISNLRIADTTQPFTRFQVPELATISPLRNSLQRNQTELAETRDIENSSDGIEEMILENFGKNRRSFGIGLKIDMVPSLEQISEVDEEPEIEVKTHNLLARSAFDA